MIAPKDEPVFPTDLPRARPQAAPLTANGSVASIPADRLYRLAALATVIFLLATIL